MPSPKDPVRLLAKTNGYTDKPSRALDLTEPEAVSADYQQRLSDRAQDLWPHLNALHDGARAAAPLDRRIARCKAQAKHLGVDVHGELRLLRLAVENGRPMAHVERRLEVLEHRLWPT